MNVRRSLYCRVVRSRVPEGSILPLWALTLRWLLFPLDSAYWALDRTRGYQMRDDVWLIEGLRYTGAAMRMLADANGEVYRVTRDGDTVSLRRVNAP